MKKNPKLISQNKKIGVIVDVYKEIEFILNETIVKEDIIYIEDNTNKTDSEDYNNEKDKIRWLKWYRNSCAFDSFFAWFVFSIYPIILKNDIFLKKNFLFDINNNQYDFNSYIEFVKILIQSENNEDFKFYIIFDDYIKNTNNYFMKFFSYEKYQFVPIVINLRNFYNNKIFCIEYQVSEYCTGNYEYSKKLTKNLYSPPFLDIP